MTTTSTPSGSAALGALIRAARKALKPKVTQAEMAERVGVSRQMYLAYERGDRVVTKTRREELAKALGVNLDRAAKTQTMRNHNEVDVSLGGSSTFSYTGVRRIPVFGTTAIARPGKLVDFWAGDNIVSYMTLPPRLATRTDVRALHVRGNRMEDRYYDGEVIVVGNTKEPEPGVDFVYIVLQAPTSGEMRGAVVRKLISLSATEIVVEQFNPRERHTILLQDIFSMERVIPLAEFAALPPE